MGLKICSKNFFRLIFTTKFTTIYYKFTTKSAKICKNKKRYAKFVIFEKVPKIKGLRDV